tara:strand:+ start:280 stop:516 length:237 start_codon:yes stop_codon:yes gene_type:complete
MDNMDFTLWVEDMNCQLHSYMKFNNYEEAKNEGYELINHNRRVKNYHVSVGTKRPSIAIIPVAYSLQEWDTHNPAMRK